MANNSAKKNEQSIRSTINILTFVVYGLIGWMLLMNSFYLIGESISIWHLLLCFLISGINYFCVKQVIKCWELQLPPEATEYYYDILVMNCIVQIVDPFTHYVWHIYWLILVYLGWVLAKWLWEYITPKYIENEQEEDEKNGKKKKEKKQKIKYVKH